jgi:anti-sigma B factor antagonist
MLPPVPPELSPEAIFLPDVRYLRTTFNGAAVVRAPAEIDLTTADQLRAALLDAAAGHDLAVVIDMTRTYFCDSSGLHVLLRAHKRMVAEGGQLRLVIPADGAVARIITLTGLRRVIPCFPSLTEALAGMPVAQPGQSAGPATIPADVSGRPR